MNEDRIREIAQEEIIRAKDKEKAAALEETSKAAVKGDGEIVIRRQN